MRLYTAELTPPTWRVRTVDSVCVRVTSGGTPSRRVATYFGGDIPWVKTKELNDGRITTTEESLTEEGVANSAAKLLPADTVLMAMYGATVGQLGLLALPMTCNQAACAMIVDDQLADSRYLFYQLLNARAQIADLANGAAQQNLNTATIKGLELPFPSLDEQRAIASLLEAVDKKIESSRRVQLLLWDLLSAEFDRLSIGAEEVQLRALLALEYGKSLPATVRVSGPVPVYGSNGVTGVHDRELISGPGIIVGRKGSIGEVHWSNGPSFPIDTTFYVVAQGGYPMLACFFALRKANLRSKNSDSAIPGLNRDAALGSRVFAPSAQLSHDWAQGRAAFLEYLNHCETEIARLSALREVLLPALLSGRVRFPEVEEVVA